MKVGLLVGCPIMLAARALGYAWANRRLPVEAPAAATTLLASLLVSLVLAVVICCRYGYKELRLTCGGRRQMALWLLCGVCRSLCRLLFFLGVQKVNPLIATVITQAFPLIVICVQMVYRRALPDSVSVMGAVLVCICATQFTVAQAGGDSSGVAFNIAGILMILGSVLADASADVILEVIGTAEDDTSRDSLVVSLNKVAFCGLANTPLMFFWANALERSETAEMFSGYGTAMSFLLCAVLPLTAVGIWNNMTVILCGAFWKGVACSLEVLCVFVGGVMIFGAPVVLNDVLSLLSLFMAVIVINVAVRKNEDEAVEVLMQEVYEASLAEVQTVQTCDVETVEALMEEACEASLAAKRNGLPAKPTEKKDGGSPGSPGGSVSCVGARQVSVVESEAQSVSHVCV